MSNFQFSYVKFQIHHFTLLSFHIFQQPNYKIINIFKINIIKYNLINKIKFNILLNLNSILLFLF